LGGGVSRLYIRSMPKSDSEATVSERHSSLDKNKEKNRQRVSGIALGVPLNNGEILA
jgi:predicted transcriptional regulator